jgi:hypothetical protein
MRGELVYSARAGVGEDEEKVERPVGVEGIGNRDPLFWEWAVDGHGR